MTRSAEDWSAEKWNPDPVENDDADKWWFWNETWTERYGPYDTEKQAREALLNYCEEYLGG